MTLKELVSTAYSPVFPGGRLGFPFDHMELPSGSEFRWISSQQFDIQAKAMNPGMTVESDLYQMLQRLLTDEFKLVIRHSTKDVPGYVLQVSPNGSKLQSATGNEPTKGTIGGGPPGIRPLVGQATPIAAVINLLSRSSGRPVQDKTGLTGLYNWELMWAADDLKVADGVPAPSLFTAVQEQLGLRLESGKVPVDILIVEYAEKPKIN
jgi:uncharacterized protein (TIGR03435 family)